MKSQLSTIAFMFVIGFTLVLTSCDKEKYEPVKLEANTLIENMHLEGIEGNYFSKPFPESKSADTPFVWTSSQIVREGAMIIQIAPKYDCDALLIGINDLSHSSEDFNGTVPCAKTNGYFQVDIPSYTKSSPSILKHIDFSKNISGLKDYSDFYDYFLVTTTFNRMPNYNTFYLYIATIDSGLVSRIVKKKITINDQASNSKYLQVSLNWVNPVDMDLIVKTPDDNYIYYSNPVGQTGGYLDLDSNPACIMDYVNNENISWGNNMPTYGDYSVFVNLWSSCNAFGTFPFAVTITNNGTIDVFSGTIESTDESQDEINDAQFVSAFSFNY